MAGRRFFTAEACVFRIITKGQKGMANKSFADVQEFLKGKVILVANRGIPARRICRSIRERFDAVAAMTATDVDKTAPSASTAKELILLGPDPRAYLDIDRIIDKARQRGVVGIHPGWGFASEDTRFPQRCKEAGITFIGATAEAMNLLGNKVQARAVARKLGIPVVPGSDGAVDIATARQLISEIGLPIMLKAEGGGGGRGIFAIHNEAELEDAFFKASTMAQASFGNPRLFVEKFLADVRHIEIQVIADMYGNVFAFDERDCTVQRNHQKLVEITPSPWPGMTRQLREQLKDYARRLVRAVGYHSLATVEFLVTPDGTPYMIEVNTRLQVEHGITECRYGIDLVEEQIAVAFGAELRYREENLRPSYCAMQVRINCENPQENFAPNAGLITRYVSPGGPGVRLDSNISAGYEFPANYDSAGSLLIAYAHDWEKTLGIMDRALSEYIIGGIKTTIPFHRQILKHPLFRKGEINTNFVPTIPSSCSTGTWPPNANAWPAWWRRSPPRATTPMCSSGNTVPSPRPVWAPSIRCCRPSPASCAASRLPILRATAAPCWTSSATAAPCTLRIPRRVTSPSPTPATASAWPKTA